MIDPTRKSDVHFMGPRTFDKREASRAKRLSRLLQTVVTLVVLCALGGCREAPVPDTELFENAEAQLRRGDFDEATRNYEEFLEIYPNSPLAPIARRRLLNIDRELEAVMGRRSSPAPIYLRPPELSEPADRTEGQ